jgi:hypothetical protein
MNNKELMRQECIIMSRVCGWIVPRHAMNPGKQAERKQMLPYDYNIAIEHQFNC